LTVTFGGSTAPSGKPEPKPVQPTEPVAKVEPPAVIAAVAPVTTPAAAPKEDDPLGLDEPAATPVAAPPTAAPAIPAVPGAGLAKAVPALAAVPVATAPTIMRIPKLEPVVPVAVATVRPSSLSIKEISTGAAHIEIKTNQPVTDYKTSKISGPERLVIDIPCEKVNQKAKTVTINKFGIAKARIGVSPKNIRIVIDSAKAKFPAHTITNTDEGLKISFK
jgi:hypothetical protein